MADDQAPGRPTAPVTPGDAGVQRAPGERRRRRSAERTGQVDLDATMSGWPVTEPPTTPRPVVRPARPTVEGVATAPVLPTPAAMVVGPLLEARSAAAPRARAEGSRRPRRGAAETGDLDAGTPARRPSPAPRALLAEAQGRGVGGLLGRLGARRALLLAAAVLAVLLGVAAVTGALAPSEDPAQAVEPVAGVPAQQTLALVLAEDADSSGLVGAALVGVDPAQVSTLLVPENLLLTVADAGEVSLTEAAVLGAEPVRRGLEDTLGLRVDGTLLVEPAQLATLVDEVGGVVLDVTTQVVTGPVLLAVGDDQRLAGAQAVAYAGLTVDGEPAEARLARFGAVLQALLAAMPAEAAQAGPALAEAGLRAGGLGADALADVVAQAAARAAAGDAEQVVLPTRELAAGGASLSGVDDEAARAELDDRFAGAVLPVAAAGEVRVLVRNGVGGSGLGAAARDLLVADGLRYVGGGNVAELGRQPTTAVLVASQEPEDRARGQAVVAALGLDDGALRVNRETLVDTDVVVVLGDDFARAVAEAGETEGAPGAATTDSTTDTPSQTAETSPTPSGEAP